MSAEDREILVAYRLEQADEALQVADMLLVSGVFRTVVNRSYYAMFYAVLALFAARQEGTSKHSGVIGLFDREFVKTGLIDREFSAWLHEAFDLRQRADYREMFTVSKERAEEVSENARQFVEAARTHLAAHPTPRS
jgi:uncharacterized protein (UPF0332 family)